jgi:hypothetical protein
MPSRNFMFVLFLAVGAHNKLLEKMDDDIKPRLMLFSP